ncbi:hypothetical protein ACFLUS_03700 [Chloroflexota bacterium]
MNSLQDISIVNMNLIPALVFIGMSDMLREILTPKIEKKLKRKMNDWDWQYYIRENFRRAEVDSRQEIIRRRQQRFGDMQIIHDFVWREDK